MSRGGDPQDTYDGYDEPDGYNDAYENEREGRTGSLFPYGVPWGGWSGFFARDRGVEGEYDDRPAETGTYEEGYDGTYDEAAYDDDGYEEDEGSWWDEGLIGTLLIVGAVLFFFPEPATSMLGVVLLGVGVIAWIADALT